MERLGPEISIKGAGVECGVPIYLPACWDAGFLTCWLVGFGFSVGLGFVPFGFGRV